MKKILLTLSLIVVFAAGELSAQLARDSWTLGFGFSYPRFVSSDILPDDGSYGGYVSIQRNFFEDVGLRFLGSYRAIDGQMVSSRTTLISGNLDMLYYFDPCSPVSPYMGIGGGVVYYNPDFPDRLPPVAIIVEDGVTAQFNMFFGGEFRLGSNWNLKAEFGYTSLASNVDGIINNNRQGIFSSNADGYINLDLGLQYYFAKGEPSNICELYDGITVDVPDLNYPTLAEIEELARKYASQPAEIDYNRIEDIIKKYPCVDENWVLTGVNFEFDKATLMPESYPILEHAVEMLKENSDVAVEIQGHTDYIGTDAYNQKLSERRAATVRDYLVSHGISASRLTTVGYGESRPVADNGTAVGRAKNRRVEFRVK